MFLNFKSLQNSSSLKSDIPCVGVLSDRDTGGGGSPDERPLLGELEEHLPVAEGIQRLALGAEGLVCHLREAGSAVSVLRSSIPWLEWDQVRARGNCNL